MCQFPSWIELSDGTALFLTDKELNQVEIDFDAVGHHAIRRLWPDAKGVDKEGFPPHPDVAAAIQRGAMHKMMRLGDYASVTKIKGGWEGVNSAGSWWQRRYKDDKPHGLWKGINSNGSWWQERYKDGKLHGLWENVHPDGSWRQERYKDDKPHGLWEGVHPDGSWWQRRYKDGKLISSTSEES